MPVNVHFDRYCKLYHEQNQPLLHVSSLSTNMCLMYHHSVPTLHVSPFSTNIYAFMYIHHSVHNMCFIPTLHVSSFSTNIYASCTTIQYQHTCFMYNNHHRPLTWPCTTAWLPSTRGWRQCRGASTTPARRPSSPSGRPWTTVSDLGVPLDWLESRHTPTTAPPRPHAPLRRRNTTGWRLRVGLGWREGWVGSTLAPHPHGLLPRRNVVQEKKLNVARKGKRTN